MLADRDRFDRALRLSPLTTMRPRRKAVCLAPETALRLAGGLAPWARIACRPLQRRADAGLGSIVEQHIESGEAERVVATLDYVEIARAAYA